MIIALALLGTAIYTVYLFLSVFFSATKLGQGLILSVLIISSFGFLTTLILSRSVNNFLVHIFYIIFSLMVGLLFYLTIFAILFQLSKLVKLDIAPLILTRIGVSLAIILFGIGVFDAAFSRVKDISIKMNGLSSNWQGKKIVQISDLHLGGIYGISFLDKQIYKINALNPDLIVITGDLFDDTETNLQAFGPELAKLKAKEGVIFVPGNHDVSVGLEKIAPILATANILTLRDQAVSINGLEIIGLDLHQLIKDDNNLVISNLEPYTGQARLLLKHVPMDISLAKNLNVDLQLSGHSHNGQMFPLSGITWFFYGKYQYGLHTEGTYNIYTSSGLGSWGPPVRTFNQAEIVAITIN